ncbi:MAG: hypothetical protein KKA97_08855, partial [Actinobacteria bacterium]|nr:hypothetical protein [Actinomycetota bacterium]
MRLTDWTPTARAWDDARVQQWQALWQVARKTTGDEAYTAVASFLSTDLKQPVKEKVLRFLASSGREQKYRAVSIPKKRGG